MTKTKHQFFSDLAHTLSNELMTYQYKADADPAWDVLDEQTVRNMKEALKDLRENAQKFEFEGNTSDR